MPTPVQHLVLAQRLLDDDSLPNAIRDRLRAQRGAFLFGNTAPDVQTVSGQLREATHFFVIPWMRVPKPHKAMFQLYPYLGFPQNRPADHAAFIAGYICHLGLDVLWVRDIYLDNFGPNAHWGANLRERHVYHNILRAWCDRHDQNQLNDTIGPALSLANPIDWLPFTADRYLTQWRDNLAVQFRPGGSIRTVEVFAERNKVPPDYFRHVLSTSEAMDAHIFSHASREKIEKFYRDGYAQMAELIVVGFKKDMFRASEALNMLKDMDSSWIVDLHDAVAVYRDVGGKLRVEQSYQMTTGQGAGLGGLFGGLVGMVIVDPNTGEPDDPFRVSVE